MVNVAVLNIKDLAKYLLKRYFNCFNNIYNC